MAVGDRNEISDVMVPSEEIHPDHQAHAKTPKHVDDDELARRSEHERDLVGGDRPSTDT
jgi:hypothetical protein